MPQRVIDGELKICPFCGRQPQLMYKGNAFYVVCYCGETSVCALKMAKQRESAIKLWNARETANLGYAIRRAVDLHKRGIQIAEILDIVFREIS